MAALRPKIVKLAKMVGGLTGMMNTIDENAPEYYSLDCVVSDEQADVALALGLRKERTAAYVAKKCGMSEEEAHRILMELAMIGVCKVYHNEQGQEVFLVQIFAPGILEMMVNNKEQLEKHPQIGKAFEEYMGDLLKKREVHTQAIGSIVGTHTGPGAVGLAYIKK